MCQGDRPAFEVRDFSGQTLTAVFVGTPSIDRLRAASRRAGRLVVYSGGPTAALRHDLAATRGAWASRVRVRSLEPEFLSRLARLVGRRTRIVVATTGQHVVVRVAGTTLDSSLSDFAVSR